MKWNQPHAVHGVETAEVPQFKILGYQTDDSIVTTATGDFYESKEIY